MRRDRALTVLAIVVVSLVVPIGAVLAECTSPPSLEDALADTSVAFIGEVTEAQFEAGEATIRVLWIWKGRDLPAEIVVQTPTDQSSANNGAVVSLRVGATYIVIPKNGTQPFKLDQCSGSRMYRADGEAIPTDLQAAVGSSTGRSPGAETGVASGDNTGALSIPLIAAASGLAGLVVFGVYRFRKRSKARSEDPNSRTGLSSSASGNTRESKPGRWRRVGGPLSMSARSGRRQVARLRRGDRDRRVDPPN